MNDDATYLFDRTGVSALIRQACYFSVRVQGQAEHHVAHVLRGCVGRNQGHCHNEKRPKRGHDGVSAVAPRPVSYNRGLSSGTVSS